MSDHDWLAAFAPEPSPESRLLAGARTRPVIARSTPPSFLPAGRARRPRTYPLVLLTVSVAALMVSGGAVGLWMRLALTPVPVAEWPALRPSIPAPPAAVPGPTVAVPAPEPAPTAPVPMTAEASRPAPIAVPAARTQSPAAVAVDSAAPGASQESAILSVLDRYRLAFSSLNPGSVRAVAFDNCRIDVQGVQAEAICAGRVSLVTRAGSQARNIQSRRWTFTLAHGRDAWRIQTVSISPTPPQD
jgi:hypothetical protein